MTAPLRLIDPRGLTTADLAKILNERTYARFIDPRDFGPMSDDPAFDNWPALQGALDRAYLNHSNGWNALASAGVPNQDAATVVMVPPCGGTLQWRCDKPLIAKGGIGVIGVSQGSDYGPCSRIGINMGGGYGLIVCKGTDNVGDNIVLGAGIDGMPVYHHARYWSDLGFDASHDLDWAANKSYWDLRECSRTMELHGLAAFCVEMTFKPDANTVADGYFIASMGRWRQSESSVGTIVGAFALQIYADGVVAHIRTSNDGLVSTSLIAGASLGIVSNPINHVLCLDYDGAHLRLLVDGVLIDSVACSGTIVQHLAEGVQMGMHHSWQPHLQVIQGAPTGYYGAFKLSKVSRHTADYTPGFGGVGGMDANVLLECDWYYGGPSTNYNLHPSGGPVFACSSNDGLVWVKRHDGEAPQSAAGMNDVWQKDVTGWRVEGLTVQPYIGANPGKVNGLYAARSGGTKFILRDFEAPGAHRIAICLGPTQGNAYGSTVQHIRASCGVGGRYACIGHFNAGLAATWRDLWLSGGWIQLVVGSGSIDGVFFEPDGGDLWWTGAAVPDRPDGGSGSLHSVMFFAGDLGNNLKIEGVNMTMEAGAYDLQSAFLMVSAGVGPGTLILDGLNILQLLTQGLVNDRSQDVDPLTTDTVPWVELDTQHRLSGLEGSTGALSVVIDNVNTSTGGRLDHLLQEIVRCVGDGPFGPCVIRQPHFFGPVPKSMCLTPGVVGVEIVNAVIRQDALAGDLVAVDNVVQSTSAANVDHHDISIPVGAGDNRVLFIIIVYEKVNAASLRNLSIGVSPWLVTNYQQRNISFQPYAAGAVVGDKIVEIYATRDHPPSATVDVRVSMTGAIGAGHVIDVTLVSLMNVQAGPEWMEAFGIYSTSKTGAHVAHAETFEVGQPDVFLLDAIAGSNGVVFTEDAGQTLQDANDSGVDVASAVSTRQLTVAVRDTMGFTFPSTAEMTSHTLLALRPAVVVFDGLKGRVFKVTLDRDVNLSHLVNLYDGMEITVVIAQDGTGGWTFTWPVDVLDPPAIGGGSRDAIGEVTTVRLVRDDAQVLVVSVNP